MVSAMVPLYGLTLLLSSALAFLVQPMVGKMILPTLGGAPAVWTTCMLFFQATLLAGYAYAHASVTWLGVRRQAGLHVVLLLVPLAVLPINVGATAAAGVVTNPVIWLLCRLLVSVGLPFFAVSTTAPLLQRWFSSTAHAAARDPYFLYAASNLGSLVGLMGYPLVVERAWSLPAQSQVWVAGYAGLIVLVAGCAVVMYRSPGGLAEAGPRGGPVAAEGQLCGSLARDWSVTMAQRGTWVALAAVPSSLMLGVTAHITTDLAAIPLLWVVPLALYLLTFVVVFARRPPVPHGLVLRVGPYAILAAGFILVFRPSGHWLLAAVLHLGLFTLVALACHGELVRRRPPARHLTEFYLCMSAGGVLGGIFNAGVAPMVFRSVLEYPLAMVLAFALLPGGQVKGTRPRDGRSGVALMGGLVLAATIVVVVLRGGLLSPTWGALGGAYALLAMLCFAQRDRPIRFALGLGVLLAAVGLGAGAGQGRALYVGRNFFGVKRVEEDRDGRFHRLLHGTTNHGAQHADPSRRQEPTSYYHRTGPVGDILNAFSGPKAKRRVAIVGLGAGAMASYAEPGQHFTFYEIDPMIERIARDRRLFTFLDSCRGAYQIVLGDGRLALADAPDHCYGLLMLDAFSSDSIPVHLLTREALQLYLAKTEADGVVLFNISNRYVDAEPLLANLARQAGLVCLARDDMRLSDEQRADGKYPSRYVVMARRIEDLGPIAANADWRPAACDPALTAWSDQYCDLLGLVLRKVHRSERTGER